MELGAGALALLAFATLSPGSAPGAAADEAASPRHLLLITVDTLRADAVGVNRVRPGGAPTPHIDALAAAGVNFGRARTVAPLTLPAHASILTGDYPPVHTVRDNGSYRLPEEAVTLAEVLARRGYETAAFVGSFVLDGRFGLAQGFATYDDRVAGDPRLLESLEAERPGDAVREAFERWLAERPVEHPLFAWIHIYDPHAPYAPPEPYASRYPRDPYAGEVAYTDEVIGRLRAALASRGLEPDTLIALVGDHGEALGEHGEGTHSLLVYNSTLHVPMILVAPGAIAPGTRVGVLVRTIDLGATLLDYLGLPPELGAGRSLRPLIAAALASPKGSGAPGESAAASARPPGGSGDTSEPADDGVSAYGESLYPQLHLGWSSLRSLETERYRLIEAPRPELYDMAADPDELNDLAAEQPDLLRRLRRQLATLEAGFPAPAAPRELDAETVERLRSLGYLGGTTAPPARGGAAIDPKDQITAWEEIQRAMDRYATGRHGEAADLFSALLERQGSTPLLYEYLGASLLELERWEEAADVYLRALAAGVDGARLRIDLARCEERRGNLEAAEQSLRIALEHDPASVIALYQLADLARRRGPLPRALELYRRALDINPDYLYAWNGLALAYASAGDDEAALAAFERAAALAPDLAEPHFNLAVQLERMGRPAAAAAYRRFLEIAGDESGWERQRRLAEEALERLEDPDSLGDGVARR